MKIIQSFWSGNQTDITYNYGWYSFKHNWISWILSCHQLIKYHEDVELYTDEFGYNILIEKLQLPYTKVHVVLDELNNYNKNLWAIGKIKAFQLQNEPFIHVDGDVFVWESLIKKFEKSNLVAQNLEITTDYYRKNWDIIYPQLDNLPKEMEDYHNEKSQFACNMGIVGGNNIDFFKEFTLKSMEFVDNNKVDWAVKDALNFNIFFEQVLFYELSKLKNQTIDYQFKEISFDNSYKGFGDFDKIPAKTFLHLLGVYKRNKTICKAMEVYVMKNFPVSYTRLMKLINTINNNDIEIDFLNSVKVTQLLTEFEFETKSNKFRKKNFLLKRDLFNIDLPNKFDKFLNDKKNFTIIKLNCYHTKNEINEEEVSYLEILEINDSSRIYTLDIVDKIILSLISKPVQYKFFIKKIKEYFDDKDNNNQFLFLINQRLRNYIILKIITIYN